MTFLQVLLFVSSGILLCWVSWVVSRYVRNRRDTFWVFVATAYLQLSGIPLFLSIFQLLTAKWFLFTQLVLAVIVCVIQLVVVKETVAQQGVRTTQRLRSTKRVGLNKVEIALLLLSLAILTISFSLRVLAPIHSGDVMYYHASRPLYWIQNLTMAPYPTVNDRQIVFAFGANLIFMWPVLFTKCEFIARLIYWLGLPLSVVGFYTVMREMKQSVCYSLLGVTAFLTMPIVFDFSNTLEPLIWVCLFVLGTGYWALRATRSTAGSLPTYLLGSYAVLAANAKNYAMALLPAGLVALTIQGFSSEGIWKDRLRETLPKIARYGVWVLLVVLISGLGLLFYQNSVLFGNPFTSDLRGQQNIAELSPYQVYVHTIRAAAVLAEFSTPIGHQFFERIGNRVIALLGANSPLPKEMEWGWVGHYRYRVSRWPSGNFGIAGLLIWLTLLVTAVAGIRRVVKGSPRNSLGQLAHSCRFAYLVVMSTLFLGTVYILRWITCGTRSFLTPAVVGLLPLALATSNQESIRTVIRRLVAFGIIVFGVLFCSYQGYKLWERVDSMDMSWGAISYAQAHHHKLIDQYVPEQATLLLLVHSNFKDYTAFGQHYSRTVVQIPEALDSESIDTLIVSYNSPTYVYINKYRYVPSLPVLLESPRARLVAETEDAKLFRLGLDGS